METQTSQLPASNCVHGVTNQEQGGSLTVTKVSDCIEFKGDHVVSSCTNFLLSHASPCTVGFHAAAHFLLHLESS